MNAAEMRASRLCYPMGPATCEWCGRDWVRKRDRRGSPYCCSDCGRAAQGKKVRERAAQRAAQRAIPIPYARCDKCGEWYVRRHRGKYCLNCRGYRKVVVRPVSCGRCGRLHEARVAKTYCPDCKKQRSREFRERHHERERARRRGITVVEKVSLRYLVERDGARCQLCGKRVKLNVLVPHPLAPTVDHIIPVAAGGVHSRRNCQLAHFRCNVRKNWRGDGQTRLWG